MTDRALLVATIGWRGGTDKPRGPGDDGEVDLLDSAPGPADGRWDPHEVQAIGHLVTAAQELESWLAYTAFRLGTFPSYHDAARLRATQLVVKVRQAAARLSDSDRADVHAALKRCSSVFNLRNVVVHALPSRRDGSPAPGLPDGPPGRELVGIDALTSAALTAEDLTSFFRSLVRQ